jgi:predicted ribosome quality control (RQC) complex YloA/Tae2 family protein
MEISAIEINLLCDRISDSVQGYFVSGIYSMEGGVLLRLNHADKPERLVAISSFASWITTKNLSVPQATKWVSQLRTLERFTLVSVSQVGNERIAKFSLKNRKDEDRLLYSEFFSHGNMIVTDPNQNDIILEVQNPQTFRHRSLEIGEKYVLPPERGIALQEVDFDKLVSAKQTIHEQKSDDNLTAIRWFGRTVGTSRKFVEEIFFRANVSASLLLASLDSADLKKLVAACKTLRSDLQKSEKGYVLVPNDDHQEIDIDVCPIVPNSWSVLLQENNAKINPFPSLSDALDEVLVQAIVLQRRKRVSEKTRAKAAELTSALTKQAAQIELNRNRALELRTLAQSLMISQIENAEVIPEIVNKLQSYDLIEISAEWGNKPRFTTEPRSFLRSYTGSSLGSRLFDEAKRLDNESRKIEQVTMELQKQRESLEETTRSQEEKAERKMVTERRERQWFERYRWFVTSDGRLSLGGRDSTSNSIVINKYTQQDDVVFHADLHGSPFFVLKNEGEKKQSLSDDISLEMAQATVSFSRAWKDELGSADAYWVQPDQIKKSAPSGEYLARGSFFIEGKKNFVKHVKVELSIGIAQTHELPILRKNIEASDASGNNFGFSLIVVCGPEKSIAGYCISRVKIAPGKERGTMFARRLKQQLVNKVGEGKAKEESKKISLDDILRVLPAGSYKVVSEKQNN